MPDFAGSIAYYGILSLFPSLLIGVGLLRLLGGSDVDEEIAEFAGDHGASGALTGALRDAIDTATAAPAGGAGALGAVGALTLLYGASRSFTAAGRGLDATRDRRPVPRNLARRVKDVGWTLALLAIGLVSVVLTLLSGRLLRDFLGLFGLDGAGVTIWSIVRWPLALLLMLLAFALIRWAAPTASHRRFRLLSPGALVAVAIWAGASAGYAIYIGSIAQYNATYGAFTGAIILLLWIWLAAAALLYGAELDAVLEETRDDTG
jgi:membrane protein